MMKKSTNMLLMLPLMISLLSGNSVIKANNSGFISGACALGAALIGAAGVAAFADWCTGETDEQMMTRIDNDCRTLDAQYFTMMDWFLQASGMVNYVSTAHKPFNKISEAVLFDLATQVWNSNISQYQYRTSLYAAKKQLNADVQKLRKHIHKLENACHTREDQKKLSKMRDLLSDVEEFFLHITFFSDCLEHHKSYFNMYDAVDVIRTRYIHELTIFESGRYTLASELKYHIINYYAGNYPFKRFVSDIETDIITLRSGLRELIYTYDTGRQYVNRLIYCLSEIRNIIVADPRYQQELYAYEQARLHKLHLDTLQHQLLLVEQSRISMEREWLRYENQYDLDSELHININVAL